MRIRSTILILVAASSSLFALPVAAQTADTQQEEARPPDEATEQPEGEAVVEEITVVGLAESLQQAVQIKRDEDAIVDAIVAADVGKLPDKNLAEAVSRVPGILINREFGEGERVSLRGAAPNQVRTAVNGHNVATADWFILDQLNATRSFNYLLLPSQMVGSLKVYKSPTADQDEGAIGGTIDVQTRRPLDQKSLTFNGSLQSAYSELSDSNDPNVEGLFSWKNAAGNVGFLASAVYQKREIRRDGVEVLGYMPDPGGSGLQVPDLIGSALFRQERERKAFNGAFQFRPTDRLEVNLNGLWSEFGADNFNQNFLAWTSQALGGGGTLSDVTVVGDTAVAGVISSRNNGTEGRGVVFDAIDRFAKSTTGFVDADFNYTLGDSWIVHGNFGYTEAEGDTEVQPFVEFGAPAAFRFDLRGSTPSVQFLNVDPTNPNQLEFDFASLHVITNDDSELYSYLDAERVLDLPTFKSLKFGVKYTDHERKADFQATAYGNFFLPLLSTGCGGRACTAADFFGGLTPGNYLDGIASNGTLDRYWQVSPGDVERLLFGSFNAANSRRFPLPPQIFSVNEEAFAGFAMAKLAGARWRGNVGLRAVRTDQTSTGNIVLQAGTAESPFGAFTTVTVDRSYNDYLPSLNFAFDVNPNVVLRLAAARTMARPDYTDIAPRVNLNEGALTGTAGDPHVDPYRATQLDVSFEHYRGTEAIVSAALFYKDIESFITDRPVDQRHFLDTNNPNTSRCVPAFSPGFPNRYSCLFTINQRTNGGGGSVKGLELNVLQPVGGGFGVQANYTYSNAEADDPGLEIPGNSKHSGNLVAFFENPRLAARVAYSYRSEFFITFDRSTRLNQDDLKSLDASLAVNLFGGLSLTLDGVNLTQEEVRQFASDRFRPRAVYDNGRYFFAGVRWNR